MGPLSTGMRIGSLVPSWTETLLWANVDVVGRTQFCVHPALSCKTIPEVEEPKRVNWKQVESLKPYLLILDQEENPRSFTQNTPVPTLVISWFGLRSLRFLEENLGD
jgi:hypothetical protein